MAAAEMLTALNLATKHYDASKSSAEKVASIDDLLVEILSRLPLKPLVRCELVSKQWQSLITKSVTPLKISKQTTTPVGLIVLIEQRTGDVSITTDYLPFSSQSSTSIVPSLENIKSILTPRYYSIHQSCNGLLLISCETPSYLDTTVTHYVCNPTTNKFFALPRIGDYDRKYKMWMSLAFDPVKSPHYKVVGIRDSVIYGRWTVNRMDRFVFQIYIYSSDNRQWRPISEQPVTAKHRFYASAGEYWNGNIHWVDPSLKKRDWFYFDMEDEMLKTGPKLATDNHSAYLGEYCDHFLEHHDLPLDVYELRKDYSEWFIKFRLDSSTLPSHMICTMAGRPQILLRAVIRGEDDNECFLVLESPRVIIRYNIVTKAYETLNGLTERPKESMFMYLLFVYRYIESLCTV